MSLNFGVSIHVLTYTTMSLILGRSFPRPVGMERFTHLTVSAGRVVLAVARQLSVRPRDTAGRVAVTFTASTHGEVGERVVVAVLGSVVRSAALVPYGVELVEDEFDIRGSHPVLQGRALVETDEGKH